MIKKFKLYIILIAMAVSSASCLDKMPEDGIPFDKSLQTVSDINLAVIGIYDAFRSNYLYSGNLTLLPDIQTDLVYGVNGNTNIYGDIWRWKEIKPTNTDIEAVYGALYEVINRCNFMLDRAAELLELEEDFNTDTQGTLYDSIYFNEYTVHALRARVLLYMKRWDEAIKYATKVIDSGYYYLSSCTQAATSSASYYKYMWTNDFSTEAIWKVGFTINSYGGALGQVFANYDYSSVRPDYVPAEWVINLYDLNDLRVSTYFQSFTTGYSHGLTWPLLIKYFGNESFVNYNILHVSMPKVLRLSEQYLIRAEAYVQQEHPDYGKAGSDISVLRTARYASYGGSTAMNKENAMDVIEQERVKELYMEGFRLHDLKRWHKGFERKSQDQSLSNGSSLKVEKDDPLFVWPIPQHELDAPGSEIEPNESNK